MPAERAWIFANGILPEGGGMAGQIYPSDLLIAADGGLRYLHVLGLAPTVLVGDMDSTPVEDVLAAERSGALVLRYPAEKDETDLDLALQYAVKAGCSQIRIAAALGGRLDQTLGNLFLLTRVGLEKVDLRLDDGCEEVFILHSQAAIHGQAGEVVSLLPLSEQVSGVTTENLRYPLTGETLYRDQTRGISNEMLGAAARVFAGRGTLLCIHTRKS